MELMVCIPAIYIADYPRIPMEPSYIAGAPARSCPPDVNPDENLMGPIPRPPVIRLITLEILYPTLYEVYI